MSASNQTLVRLVPRAGGAAGSVQARPSACGAGEGAPVYSAKGQLVGVVDGRRSNCSLMTVATVWGVRPYLLEVMQTDAETARAASASDSDAAVSITQVFLREEDGSGSYDFMWTTFAWFILLTVALWSVLACIEPTYGAPEGLPVSQYSGPVPQSQPPRQPPGGEVKGCTRCPPRAPPFPPGIGRDGNIWYAVS